MICKLCAADPKPPNFESTRKCAFAHGNNFSHDNWQCGTMNAIRQFAAETAWTWEDESCSVYPLHLETEPDGKVVHSNSDAEAMHLALEGRCKLVEGGPLLGFLVLTWYKRRGCTQGAVVMDTGMGGHHELTLELAEALIQ